MAATVPLGLYVHLPWCVRKCPYCDFNSHQLKSARPDRAYLDALIEDFAREAILIDGRRIQTVFFGGGTPSLFQPEEFHRLLQALKQRADFAPDAEVTLEANPGTLERGVFSGYRDAGINRVSLGAQSFSGAALHSLGRIHAPEDTERAAEELHAAGLSNFNLDLMYALPQQTLAEALTDVQRACELKPAHISHYQLTLEPGTVFYTRPPPLPDEDAAWQMQVQCQAALQVAGFGQYEVSAYAQGNARCRHNLNYWNFGDYIGIGAGAHGKLTRDAPQAVMRTAKPKQPSAYQHALVAQAGPIGERANIALAQIPFEFMLNALRLNAGFSRAGYRARTGLELAGVQPLLQAAQTRGLLEATPEGWRPSDLGRRFLNDLQASFLGS
jgi:putative oxygen-independent coproporphyrinogen III oxidase